MSHCTAPLIYLLTLSPALPLFSLLTHAYTGSTFPRSHTLVSLSFIPNLINLLEYVLIGPIYIWRCPKTTRKGWIGLDRTLCKSFSNHWCWTTKLFVSSQYTSVDTWRRGGLIKVWFGDEKKIKIKIKKYQNRTATICTLPTSNEYHMVGLMLPDCCPSLVCPRNQFE